MTKTKTKTPCEHKSKIYFLHMNGFYCPICKDSFINGQWTKKKNKKKIK